MKKKIFFVESNPKFYKYMNSIPAVRDTMGKSLLVKFVDVGETNDIGMPISREKEDYWHKYFSDIWEEIDLKENKIDIIFIDGRFRVACIVYSIFKILKNNLNNPYSLFITFVIENNTI